MLTLLCTVIATIRTLCFSLPPAGSNAATLGDTPATIILRRVTRAGTDFDFVFTDPRSQISTPQLNRRMMPRMMPKDTVDSTHEQDILPRDIFSKWSYVLINYKLLSLLSAFELLIVGYIFCFAARSNGDAIVTLILGTFFVTSTGVAAYFGCRDIGLTDENKMIFLKEVTVARPGLDSEIWNAIARQLNPIFYQNSRSATPYFFYDGEACSSCFRRNFLTPYYFRQRKPRQDAGEGITESSEPRETETRSPNYQFPRSELDTFIEMAVKAHEESLKAYWNDLGVGNSYSPSN